VVFGSAVGSALPFSSRPAIAATAFDYGEHRLSIVSDGHLTLPTSFLQPPNMSDEVFNAFVAEQAMDTESYQPACNLTLWEFGERKVLFDAGAGDGFMDSTGKLLSNLAAANIDPASITDVVFTHAHPDHLWGLVDDFDEIVFPNASFYMHEREWDFWSADDTVSKMPESRKVFAVGAQNRFAYLEDQIQLFGDGDEIIPSVEVVFTPGHTPGHSAFALHAERVSTMVVGDALTHPVLSFQPKKWLSNSDQDSELGQQTRARLLDRLAMDKMQLLAYHLPTPGVGFAERRAGAYEFVPL